MVGGEWYLGGVNVGEGAAGEAFGVAAAVFVDVGFLAVGQGGAFKGAAVGADLQVGQVGAGEDGHAAAPIWRGAVAVAGSGGLSSSSLTSGRARKPAASPIWCAW